MQAQDDRPLSELAAEVAALAIVRGISVASAESCTGGLIAHLLTQTSGISAVYPGSIVAYANEAKRDLLDVEQHTLDGHGAVSAPVAVAMARGVRRRFGAAVGVSTTGIAGPTGATPDKPVGLTYVAVSSEGEDTCRRFRFTGDRAENIEAAAREALSMLFQALSTKQD